MEIEQNDEEGKTEKNQRGLDQNREESHHLREFPSLQALKTHLALSRPLFGNIRRLPIPIKVSQPTFCQHCQIGVDEDESQARKKEKVDDCHIYGDGELWFDVCRDGGIAELKGHMEQDRF